MECRVYDQCKVVQIEAIFRRVIRCNYIFPEWVYELCKYSHHLVGTDSNRGGSENLGFKYPIR